MNYKQLIMIPLTLFLLTTVSSATLYSDAEDGTVDAWKVRDNRPLGATIANVMDYSKNSRVIELRGFKRRNAYILGNRRGNSAWHNRTERKLRWSMNFSERFKIVLYVQTEKGQRVLIYNHRNRDRGFYRNKYIKFGLGYRSMSGTWQKFSRDLDADIRKYEPDNRVLEVNGFKVRGSGKIDDVELYNDVPESRVEREEVTGNESKLERLLTPRSSLEEQKLLAKDNNDFAFEMFKMFREKEKENIFFSPYSISTALVMTYAGANGETKAQMARALHFNDENLHNRFNALDLHINHNEGNYTVSVANSLWPAKEFTFKESYLDTIKRSYGAKLRPLDYIGDTEASRKIINSWVEKRTHNRIKNIIQEGTLSSLTRLTLVNAIYFKAKWKKTFSSYMTKEDRFTKEDGLIVQKPFMEQTETFLYREHDDFQAITLPYEGGRSSMQIILPKVGKYNAVINNLNRYYLLINSDSRAQRVKLKFPKFEFSTRGYQLRDSFLKLGVVDAFSSQADFRGITKDGGLHIDEIIHKAFIKVDENGTEAAAATVVMMRLTSINPFQEKKPIEMSVNRPFIFFIKDNMSQQILFIGSIKEPKL